MSDANGHDNGGDSDGAAGEVLRNLPRTRPQRPSARRVHASDRPSSPRATPPPGDPAEASATAPRRPRTRATTAKSAPRSKPQRATPKTARAPQARSTATPRRAAKTATAAPSGAPQGFETDAHSALDPPGVADVLDSALGAAGDLVQSGLDLSGRVVRGALSKLLGSG